MYSRNYYDESEANPRPPENYNGTIFTESDTAAKNSAKSEPDEEISDAMAHTYEKEKTGGLFSSLTRNISLPAFFGKLGFSSLSLPNFGTEEILIIAVAAYLFFSKEGDKECAVMLLLLLFVS